MRARQIAKVVAAETTNVFIFLVFYCVRTTVIILCRLKAVESNMLVSWVGKKKMPPKKAVYVVP